MNTPTKLLGIYVSFNEKGNNQMNFTIQQLFNENGQFLTFQEFQAKYHCNTNFLQFYQILSAIPVRLKNRARVLGQNAMSNYRETGNLFY